MTIHSSSIVSPTAQIADDVEIGPLCVIESGVQIGSGCRLSSHVVIKEATVLGRDNHVDVGAVLGGAPQHLGVGKEVGGTVIGDGNRFREFVTIHRAYLPDKNTRIGNQNMFMASSHVGHDCAVGDSNILANNVLLAGHVTVGDQNYFGGGAAVHQFCRAGSLAMIGGLARITRDIPPYVLVDGTTNCLVGLNSIGLRRAGMPPEIRRELKDAYRIAFRSELPMEDRLALLQKRFPLGPAREIWQFVASTSRGVLQDRRVKKQPSRENREKEPARPNQRNADTPRQYPRAA